MKKNTQKATPPLAKPRSSLVYTTDPDPPEAEAVAAPAPVIQKEGQLARISLDRKRRRGKTVTVIAGLHHDPATFEALLRKLKQQCGAGGTYKEGEIEIQGDHRERVAASLVAMGYKTKLVGG